MSPNAGGGIVADFDPAPHISMPRPVLLPLTLALLAGLASAAPAAPRLATIAIPGDARFVAIARDVALAQTEETPDFAAQSGLIDDAIRVPSFAVVGADNYAWRLRHANLLPWTPDALLALAQQALKATDAEIAALVPQLPKEAPLSPGLEAQAKALDQARLLALYDHIQVDSRAAIEKAGFVTIPAGVDAIRARVTPDAMVPLTGDGGSMNPPPPFIADDTGWWNVEHL